MISEEEPEETLWTKEEWLREQMDIWNNQLPEAPPTPPLDCPSLKHNQSQPQSSTDPWTEAMTWTPQTPEHYSLTETPQEFELTPCNQPEEEEEDPFGHGFELD